MLFTIGNIQGHDSMWDIFLNVKEDFVFSFFTASKWAQRYETRNQIWEKKCNFEWVLDRN